MYMDTFDAINQRRSVKAFDPSHRLNAAEETKLLDAAIQSPTSFDMQNWRFVIVRDPELRKQIRAAEIINLPSDRAISFLVAVGKAVKPASPKGGQLDLAEVVVQDRFA